MAGFVFSPACPSELSAPMPRPVRATESMQQRNGAEHFIADQLQIRGDSGPILRRSQMLDTSADHFLRRFAASNKPKGP